MVVYPGTFDPITNGHIDLVERGLKIFGSLTIAVAENSMKAPLFTLEERLELIKKSIGHLEGVTISSFKGLLVDYVGNRKAKTVLRGLRAVSDFEYEMQMALTNRYMAPDIETIFMMPSQEYTFLNSTMVKQMVAAGGCVKGLAPVCVEEALELKFKQKK